MSDRDSIVCRPSSNVLGRRERHLRLAVLGVDKERQSAPRLHSVGLPTDGVV